MRKITLAILVLAFAMSAFGQTPTLRIVTDDPNLPSDLFYGSSRVTPLRLRPGTNTPITIDDSDFFVFEQYVDFLSRMPDQAGQDYWTSQLTSCSPQPSCLDRRRVEVSTAFFIEQEYQATGYFVYKLYRGVLGRYSTYAEFKPDRRQIVGGAQLLESKKAFAAAFIQRAEFQTKYPASLSTAAQFVDAVLATVQTTTGADLSASRLSLISAFGDAADGGRARVIREVADNPTLSTREYNRGFVAIQYWGYLQRDYDQGGYDFWLNALNNSSNNQSGMVCSFITAAEYQLRFGTNVTRTNALCQQLYP